MPISTFVDGEVIDVTRQNANFALCVLTDTARSITVTHTWSAAQLNTVAGTAMNFTPSSASHTAIRFNLTGGSAAGFVGVDRSAAIATGSTDGDLILRSDLGNIQFCSSTVIRATLSSAGAFTTAGGVSSTSSSGGVGYGTGAGGAITQGTSRTTAVQLDKVTGAITLFSAAGSATPATFTLTNSTIAATDVVHVTQKSGTDKYEIFVTATAAGSCAITFFTTGGTTTEQPVFNFVVIKGVAA
jgi:hypothetical protein